MRNNLTLKSSTFFIGTNREFHIIITDGKNKGITVNPVCDRDKPLTMATRR